MSPRQFDQRVRIAMILPGQIVCDSCCCLFHQVVDSSSSLCSKPKDMVNTEQEKIPKGKITIIDRPVSGGVTHEPLLSSPLYPLEQHFPYVSLWRNIGYSMSTTAWISVIYLAGGVNSNWGLDLVPLSAQNARCMWMRQAERQQQRENVWEKRASATKNK